MAKIDFDNLMKSIKARLTVTGTAVSSVELDLELPRGYIAKIKKIRFLPVILANFGLGDVDQFEQAIVRDPDEILQTSIPNNRSQHDVLADNTQTVTSNTGALAINNGLMEINFNDEDDVVTARNLRYNVKALIGTVLDDSAFDGEVFYTLEKVTDNQILELLDIL